MRVALVGAGAIAREMHVPALRALAAIEIVSVCDVNIERAQHLAAMIPGARAFVGLDEALSATGRPDAVDIATPPQHHAAMALHALDAGCHVLIEKPAALSASETRRIADVASKRGLRAAVVQSYRCRDSVIELLRYLKAGRLGRLRGVTTVSHGDDAFDQRTAWVWQEAPDKLLLYELAVHYVDLELAFAGPVRSVGGVHVERRPSGELTGVVATIDHESGAAGVLDMQIDSSSRFLSLSVFGSNLDATIKLFPEHLTLRRGQSTPVTDLVDDGKRLARFAYGRAAASVAWGTVPTRVRPHYRLITSFINVVQGRAAKSVADIESVIPTMELLDELYRMATPARRP